MPSTSQATTTRRTRSPTDAVIHLAGASIGGRFTPERKAEIRDSRRRAADFAGLTFAVAVRIGKHSVVDTAWGTGIVLAALTAFGTFLGHGQAERRYLLLVASVLWGLRLAGYVGWRNHGKPEDPRYQDMLAKATGSKNLYALRKIYLLQAAILWFAVGFFFESVKLQTACRRRSPAGKGLR